MLITRLMLVAVASAISLSWMRPAALAQEESPARTLNEEVLPPRGVMFTREPVAVGTGCPDGTVFASLNGDKVFIGFTKFFTEIGAGMTAETLNCTITLGIDVPDGYSFGISHYSYTVESLLNAPGVRGMFLASYGYSGQGQGPAAWKSITKSEIGSITHELRDDEIVYAHCGKQRDVVVDVTITLLNSPDKSGNGRLNVQYASAAVGEAARKNVLEKPPIVLDFKWKECDPTLSQ